MLTKQQLRSRAVNPERRYKVVPLKDGSEVRLQSMTRAEQRQWRKSFQKKDGTPDPQKVDFSNDILLAMTIVDDKGELAFSVGDALSGMFDFWDTADTSLLVEMAVEHCGLVVDLKEIESITKNSKETPGSDSSGVSPGKQDSPSTKSTSDTTTNT